MNKNKFLELNIPKNKNFFYYIFGSLLIILSNFLGQIPLLLFINNQISEVNDMSSIFNILDKNLSFFLVLFPFLVSFISFIFIIKLIHNQSLTDLTTSRKRIDYKRIISSFLFWSSIILTLFLAGYLINPKGYTLNFKLLPFLTLFFISIIFIPFQASLEEYIFRGYLMQGFFQIFKNRFLPLVFTSFIFGFLHYFNPEVEKLGLGIMIYYVMTGFFFGIITLLDEGIEIPIGLHIANNLVTALLVTADWTAFQTESVFIDFNEPNLIKELVTYLILVYPLTLIFFSKKYKWKSWKIKILN